MHTLNETNNEDLGLHHRHFSIMDHVQENGYGSDPPSSTTTFHPGYLEPDYYTQNGLNGEGEDMKYQPQQQYYNNNNKGYRSGGHRYTPGKKFLEIFNLTMSQTSKSSVFLSLKLFLTVSFLHFQDLRSEVVS